MKNYTVRELTNLIDALVRDYEMHQDAAEALVHALTDIYEAIVKIQQTLEDRDAIFAITADQELDALVALRTEIRHIDYHIHDASLTDLAPVSFEQLLENAIFPDVCRREMTPQEYQAAREVITMIQGIYRDVVTPLLEMPTDLQVMRDLMRQLRFQFWKVDVFIHHERLLRI